MQRRIIRQRAGFLVLLPACCVTLAAQSTPPAAPASVSGVVINSVTGDPILRAHVVLQGMGEMGGAGFSTMGGMGYSISRSGGMRIVSSNSDADSKNYGALTNGEGKFSVATLPPGQYLVTVERLGFVAPVNLPAGTNTITLAAGDKREDLKLKLIPAGVITGRILGAGGEPVPNAEVRAEGARGTRQAQTDEQGRYRIGALDPGKYRLRAAPRQQPFGAEIRTDGSREVHYAATYYPDSTAHSSARAIDVQPAAQLTGIDIRLVSTPIVLVSGHVTGMPAGNVPGLIQALPEGEMFGGGPQNTIKADGTFTISNLDPGKYTLVAATYGPGSQRNLQSAPLEIEVAGANIEHLELRMIPPFEVTGQMRFDDAQIRFPKARPRPEGMPDDAAVPAAVRQIHLQSLGGGMRAGGTQAEIGPDDSFTLEKVAPGRYHVTLSWGPGYVRSVRAGSTETEGDVLDLSSGPPGAVVVSVSALTCEVSGTVNDASGPVANAHVVLVPESGSRQYVRAAETKADGTYSFTGVPPGKFKLAATDEGFYPNAMQALEDYRDVAEDIDLHPGDKLTKDLKRK
jgi:protocatechuate 3,4-dioxygenase beta subunit